MSDHGARAMVGGVLFNDWLMREGYLTMTQRLDGPVPIGKAPVDWSKTAAWGDGGYYGRLFLNVKGREPQGIVDPADYEKIRDEIAAKLEAMHGPDGTPLGTRVIKPQDVYPKVRGVAPDLLVYFGDLEWRSVGMVNMEGGDIFTYENDTGPDGAQPRQDRRVRAEQPPGPAHGQDRGPQPDRRGPTLIKLYGLSEPEGVEGRSIL